MKTKPSDVSLAHALIQPAQLKGSSRVLWDHLIRQARSANLLCRLAELVMGQPWFSKLDADLQDQLKAAIKQAHRQHTQVIWEAGKIVSQLKELGIRPILLKGAAYVVDDLPPKKGRTLSDIDILVPEESINQIERHLFIHGWLSEKKDAQDEKYYREWTHEIPPLQHIKSGTVLDVHHNIFPVIRGMNPGAIQLLNEAEYHPEGYGTLHLHDMIIHSATHLFWEGEFENGLRDLHDMYLLFNTLEEAEFQEIAQRAIRLGLGRPLYYAGRYCEKVFNLVLPRTFHATLKPIAPSTRQRAVMDFLFLRALSPHHPLAEQRFKQAALFILYWRGHLLRLPVSVLIPHLTRKYLKKIRDRKKPAAPTAEVRVETH